MKFKIITLEIPFGMLCRKGKDNCKYFEVDPIEEDCDTGELEESGYCTLFNEYLNTEKVNGVWVSYKSEFCEALGGF